MDSKLYHRRSLVETVIAAKVGASLLAWLTSWRLYSPQQRISTKPTIYIAARDGNLYAIRGEAGPAQSPWPMFRQNPQRTGAKP